MHYVKSVHICSFSGLFSTPNSVRIQSECRKMRTRKTPNAGTFHALMIMMFANCVFGKFQRNSCREIVEKFLKFSKIGFPMECFTAHFSQIFSINGTIFRFGLAAWVLAIKSVFWDFPQISQLLAFPSLKLFQRYLCNS